MKKSSVTRLVRLARGFVTGVKRGWAGMEGRGEETGRGSGNRTRGRETGWRAGMEGGGMPCIRRFPPPPATQYERQLKQGAVLTKRHDDIAFSPQLIKMKAILNLFWSLLIVNWRLPGFNEDQHILLKIALPLSYLDTLELRASN